MKCYIVSFDIESEATRQQLKGRLKKYSAFCPITRNCWAVLTDQTAAAVRDYLTPVLDSDDRLFVVRSGTEAAWRNSFGPKNNDWLKKNL